MKPYRKVCPRTTSKYVLMSGPKIYATDTIATFIKQQNNKAYGKLFVQLLVLAEVRRRKQSLRNKARRPTSLTYIPKKR